MLVLIKDVFHFLFGITAHEKILKAVKFFGIKFCDTFFILSKAVDYCVYLLAPKIRIHYLLLKKYKKHKNQLYPPLLLMTWREKVSSSISLKSYFFWIGCVSIASNKSLNSSFHLVIQLFSDYFSTFFIFIVTK